MFQVKICGITNAEDARLASAAGADAIGLNFYAKSRRYVDPRSAQQIAAAAGDAVKIVGLFVNSSADEIKAIRDVVPLDIIQLHGDETPELLAEIEEAAVLRAFRYGDNGVKPIAEYLDRCGELDCVPDAVLIDAHVAGQFGGTGQRVDWQRLAEQRGEIIDRPWILAGGLTPDNVAEAIQLLQPHGVDVSSGVELASLPDSPPRKDATRVRAFVATATEALR